MWFSKHITFFQPDLCHFLLPCQHLLQGWTLPVHVPGSHQGWLPVPSEAHSPPCPTAYQNPSAMARYPLGQAKKTTLDIFSHFFTKQTKEKSLLTKPEGRCFTLMHNPLCMTPPGQNLTDRAPPSFFSNSGTKEVAFLWFP